MNIEVKHVSVTMPLEAKCMFVAGIVIGVFGLKKRNIESIEARQVIDESDEWEVRIRLRWVWASTLPILIARQVCTTHCWYKCVNIIGNDIVIRIQDSDTDEKRNETTK